MKKPLLFLLPLIAFAAPDDLILSQAKNPGPGNIQRNLAPTANGLFTFDSSKVPVSLANYTLAGTVFGVPDAFSVTSAGSIDLTAGGVNENIQFTPGTVGDVRIPLAGGHVKLGVSVVDDPVTGSGIVNVQNESATFQQDTYSDTASVSPFLMMRRARGTFALPSAVQLNDTIFSFSGRAYGQNAFSSGSRVDMNFFADEAWTNTAQGTYIRFRTTPRGSDSAAEAVRIASNGTLNLPGSIKRVTVQFDKTDVTLANITGLSVPLNAATSYRFRAVLFTTSNVGGGVKAAIASSGTVTSIIYEGFTYSAGAITQTRSTASAGTVGAVTAVTAATIIIEGAITTNALGNLTVQFAANVAVGTSSVLPGSYLEVIGF